jgi:hypothetical protein
MLVKHAKRTVASVELKYDLQSLKDQGYCPCGYRDECVIHCRHVAGNPPHTCPTWEDIEKD